MALGAPQQSQTPGQIRRKATIGGSYDPQSHNRQRNTIKTYEPRDAHQNFQTDEKMSSNNILQTGYNDDKYDIQKSSMV